jgi:hypothetical protein
VGFSALPGGLGYEDGGFGSLDKLHGFGSDGSWWSAVSNDNSNTWIYYEINLHNFVRKNNDGQENNLISVRCLQGETGEKEKAIIAKMEAAAKAKAAAKGVQGEVTAAEAAAAAAAAQAAAEAAEAEMKAAAEAIMRADSIAEVTRITDSIAAAEAQKAKLRKTK